jgi:hypothetical protein
MTDLSNNWRWPNTTFAGNNRNPTPNTIHTHWNNKSMSTTELLIAEMRAQREEDRVRHDWEDN